MKLFLLTVSLELCYYFSITKLAFSPATFMRLTVKALITRSDREGTF